jgi:hypothetical protein
MIMLYVFGYLVVGWLTDLVAVAVFGIEPGKDEATMRAAMMVIFWPIIAALSLTLCLPRIIARTNHHVYSKARQAIDDRRAAAKREAGQLTVTDDAPKGALSMEGQ